MLRFAVGRKLTLGALATALAATAATAVVASSNRDVDESFPSVALAGKAHALVVLPPDYATSGLRYPVVYFLHGLPAPPTAYRSNGWVERALEAAGPAILVEPQGARAGDSDSEYLDRGAGRNWETFLTGELPRYIDAHFRTIRDRRARALVGLSAGGYGAAVLGLRHLGTFSVIESWSVYFHPTDPTGTKALDLGPSTSAHNLIEALRADERQRPTFFAFYVGRGDAHFRAENVLFDRELTRAAVPHVFELYRGGHDTAVWEAHASGWLGMALGRLDRPER